MKKLYLFIFIGSVFISCNDVSLQNTDTGAPLTVGDILFSQYNGSSRHYSTYTINSDGSGLMIVNDSMMVTSPSYSGIITLAKIDSGTFFNGLYVLYTENSALINVPGNYYYPVYFIISPTGDNLLFTTMAGQMCVIKPDGTGLMQLSNGLGAGMRAPEFSPDGKKIAYYENTVNDQSGLYIINTNGSGKKQVLPGISFGTGAIIDWSPDGSKLVFENGQNPYTNICIVDTGGSNYTVLANGVNPSWSRDGLRIAFLKNVNQGFEDVFIINTDGSGIQKCFKYV